MHLVWQLDGCIVVTTHSMITRTTVHVYTGFAVHDGSNKPWERTSGARFARPSTKGERTTAFLNVHAIPTKSHVMAASAASYTTLGR